MKENTRKTVMLIQKKNPTEFIKSQSKWNIETMYQVTNYIFTDLKI